MAPRAVQTREILSFGPFRLVGSERLLTRNGAGVKIGGRAFDILTALISCPNEVVSKNDLLVQVWPDVTVEEGSLRFHIANLRKALGDGQDGARYIATLPGRGYCFVAPVIRSSEQAEESLALDSRTTQQENTWPKSEVPEQKRTAAHPFLTNVPVAASALIGRDTTVQHLRDLVATHRVVTLTGPGGIGKTVLASEVARRLFPALASDVLFVELVSLSDPELVPSKLAYTLHLQLAGDEVTPESVARAIGSKKILLVLDNCEHVIDAAARMAETLVRLCPHTTVLATSREVLRIDGEFVYRVPPLEVPAEHLEVSYDVLEHSAVQLFIARTQSLRADFRPQNEKIPVIAAICRRLDGIPLAIEFAAARAATLGIQQVAAYLDDRFTLLIGGRRTALPRQQTLRATLDWSYGLLPEGERRLLRQLAVFPAGFTLEAATAVADDMESSVALGVSSLVSKSLVAFDGSETVRRWRLLETVRAYLLEKLTESGEYEEAVRRLAEFYLTLFAPFSIECQLQAAIDDLGRYRPEVDNLRAALSWAFSSGGDAALGVELAATASDFWAAVSLIVESCEWAGKALARIGDAAGTRREMALRCSLGFSLIYTQGMSANAREVLIRALELARELHDFDYQQRATFGLWLFSSRAMAINDALASARDYEEVARVRDLQSRATASWLVGIQQTYLGEHIQASERLDWAIDQYPVARRRRDIIRLGADLRASALGHNTVNLLSRGHLDAALKASRSAIKEARRTNQPTVLCVALAWAAGFVSLSLGDLDKVREYGEELVDHAFRHALRPFYAAGLCVRGSLSVKRGEPESGIGSLRSGLAEMQDTMYLLFFPFFRAELAVALGAIGRVDGGLGEIDETLRLAVKMDYRWFVPEILRIKGELLALRNFDDAALIEELFRQSMLQASAQKAAYWELSSAISLAEFLRGQNRDVEARAVLMPVYDRFTKGFSAARVKQAKGLLDQLA